MVVRALNALQFPDIQDGKRREEQQQFCQVGYGQADKIQEEDFAEGLNRHQEFHQTELELTQPAWRARQKGLRSMECVLVFSCGIM